jgi:hypothetical protein
LSVGCSPSRIHPRVSHVFSESTCGHRPPTHDLTKHPRRCLLSFERLERRSLGCVYAVEENGYPLGIYSSVSFIFSVARCPVRHSVRVADVLAFSVIAVAPSVGGGASPAGSLEIIRISRRRVSSVTRSRFVCTTSVWVGCASVAERGCCLEWTPVSVSRCSLRWRVRARTDLSIRESVRV